MESMRGWYNYTPAIGKSLFGRKAGRTLMPRFDKSTMVKRGKSCVTDTWAKFHPAHKKAMRKKRRLQGWQPNINGPYSGFK